MKAILEKLRKIFQGPWKEWIRRERGVWVFEIGNEFLKGVLCLQKGRHYVVEKVLVEPLPSPHREAIQAFFFKITQEPTGKFPVWVFISRNLVTLRSMELPTTEPRELGAMVDLQIGKHTPYRREEIVAAWQVVSQARPGFSRANLAIVHHSLLAETFQALEESGLKVDRVGLISNGLTSFAPSSAAHTYILSLDRFYTEFQFVAPRIKSAHSRLLYSRVIPVGDARLSETETDAWEKIFTEIKRSLEVVRSLEIVSPAGAHPPPASRVLLLGVSTHLKVMAQRLTEELGLSCEIAAPLEKTFAFSEKALPVFQNVSSADSLYGLLGSLALSPSAHFDLMPPPMKLRLNLEEKTRELVQLGVLLGIFVMTLSGFSLERVYKRNAVLAKFDERYERTAPEAEQLEKMWKMLEVFRKREQRESSALHLLELLHQIAPQNIYYLSLFFEEGKAVSLKGNAKAMPDVFDFVAQLDRSQFFKKVETKYATRKRIREEEFIEFEVEGRMQEGP